jgi:hypothetical protein
MYSTNSVAEAAYLMARGLELQEVAEQRNTRMKCFVFGPEASKIAPEFYGNTPVPAYDFHLSLQAARRLIRNS